MNPSKPHQVAARQGRTFLLSGVFFLLLVPVVYFVHPAFCIAAAAVGIVMLTSGRRQTALATGPAVMDTALMLVAGRFEEAARELAAPPEASLRDDARARSVHFQLGTCRFFLGDFTAAEHELTEAVARSKPSQKAPVLVLRALVRACAHDDAGARDDLGMVTTDELAPEARARMVLTRAILATRDTNADAMHAALRAVSRYPADLMPLERALGRALRRCAHASNGTAYRAAPQDPEKGPRKDEWARAILPGAPAATVLADAGEPPRLADASAEALQGAHTRSRVAFKITPHLFAVAAVGVLVAVSYGGVWLATGLGLLRPDVRGVDGTYVLVVMVVLALTVGFLAGTYSKKGAARAVVALESARRLAARRRPEAEPILAKLASPNSPVTFLANLLLITFEIRQARFREAGVRAAAAFAQTQASEALRQATASMAAPGFLAARAYCAAAEGREEEAIGDLALLDTLFPAYPLRERAHFQVTLMALLARGDIDGARKVAARRPQHMWLAIEEDVLCILLVATGAASLPSDERDALAEELAVNPDAVPFIERLAPGLATGFLAASTGAARVVEEADPAHEGGDDSLGERTRSL